MIKIEGHTINPNLLNRGSIVIDIGGKEGRFSKEIIRQFACYVECYEPDNSSYEGIKNSLNLNNFKVFHSAVAGEAGEKIFYSAEPRSGGNSLLPNCREFLWHPNTATTYMVNAITLDSIINKFPKIDLIKMDCEGAEIDIIHKTPIESFQKVKQLTIEFHDFAFESIKREDIINSINKLTKSGFKPIYQEDHLDPDRDYFFYRE